jgi:hypothetical protein
MATEVDHCRKHKTDRKGIGGYCHRKSKKEGSNTLDQITLHTVSPLNKKIKNCSYYDIDS